MSATRPILVLSTCTAKKIATGIARVPAEELYDGQQHRHLMRGVELYRAAAQPYGELELKIVSAGYGVVAGDELLHGYDSTFVGMRSAQLRRRAAELNIPQAVSSLLAGPRRLA